MWIDLLLVLRVRVGSIGKLNDYRRLLVISTMLSAISYLSKSKINVR